MDKTADLAKGRWRGILSYLGVDERFLKNQHGPCPICGGTKPFRFDDKDGNGTFYCTHCGPGNGFTLLQNFHRWDFQTAAAEVDKIVGNIRMEKQREEKTEAQKVTDIKRVLEESKPITPGDPVWLYLESRCQPVRPKGLVDLRYHFGLFHPESKDYLPCMIAVMRYADGTGATLHRTYLTKDGRKAPVQAVRRIMPGKPIPGSAVRIGGNRSTSVLAEGVETTLCACHRWEMAGFAAISAEGMKSWIPPSHVRKVLVCGDNDTNFTGQAAAYEAARRLVLQFKLEVEVHIPQTTGSDWADMHGL